MTIEIGLIAAGLIVLVLVGTVVYFARHPELVPFLKIAAWLVGKVWGAKIKIRPADPSEPAMRKAEGNGTGGLP
jgi:hypothetical protein